MKTENTSGLHPVGRAILVEVVESEFKTSIIAIPDHVKARTTMVESTARVIEIGSEAWKDEAAPRAKVGDKVYITKFAGYIPESSKDGKNYRLINDRDIFCRVDD